MLNNIIGRIASLNIDPKIASLSFNDRISRGRSNVEVRTSYNNFMPIPIVVVERNGLRHLIESTIDTYFKCFVIRVEYILHENTARYLDILMAKVGDDNHEEIKLFKEAYLRQRELNSYRGASVVLDYEISLEQLKDAKGILYYKNKDVLISTLSLDQTPPHPYCEGTVRDDVFDYGDSFKVDKLATVLKIEIVDNNKIIGDRYFYFANEVHRIYAITDDTRSDGVYVSKIVSDITDKTKHQINQLRYDISDCEVAFGLFPTASLAETNGDISTARKEELLRMEHDLTVMKNQFQQEKQKCDAEIAERQHLNKIKELELSEKQSALEKERKEFDFLQERRRIEMKDYYDQRMNERKDTSDLVKILPALIIAVGVIVGTMNKSQQSKS